MDRAIFGTGVVGLNTPVSGTRIVGDSNPHIIKFYNGIKDGIITPHNMREYLSHEGFLLEKADNQGYDHYRKIKDRLIKNLILLILFFCQGLDLMV